MELSLHPCAITSIIYDPLSRTITAESITLGLAHWSNPAIHISGVLLLRARPLCCSWWALKNPSLFMSVLLNLVLSASLIFHAISRPVFWVTTVMFALVPMYFFPCREQYLHNTLRTVPYCQKYLFMMINGSSYKERWFPWKEPLRGDSESDKLY